jgi:hypothetical protein
MPFTQQKDEFRAAQHLNMALLRSAAYQQNWSGYSGEVYHHTAKLSPTEYHANQPVPLLFDYQDIWQRMMKLQGRSEFLVQQFLEFLQELDELERSRSRELSSANHALAQVGDLVYDVNRRMAGINQRRDELIDQLRYALGLPPAVKNEVGGARLDRS